MQRRNQLGTPTQKGGVMDSGHWLFRIVALIALIDGSHAKGITNDVDVVIAWRTDGINAESPSDVISEIIANPTGPLATSLSTPTKVRPTFRVPNYPGHIVVPANSAIHKMKQYITVSYPRTMYESNKRLLANLKNDTRLGYVGTTEENVSTFSQLPNDPFFLTQETAGIWHPDGTPTMGQWQMLYPYLNVPTLGSFANLGWGSIGITDAAPLITHPDLNHAFALANSISFPLSDGDPLSRNLVYETTQEYGFHGTHVSGIAAARANNEIGIVGVCSNCTILYGASYSEESWADAAHWLGSWGAQVINLSGGFYQSSFGGIPGGTPCSNYSYNPNLGANPFCVVLSFLSERDITYVAAAGNNRTIVDFPASDDLAQAVAGYDYDAIGVWAIWDELNHWVNDPGDYPNGCPSAHNPSKFGHLQCGSNFGLQVDFVAPARNIVSTVKPGTVYAGGLCSDASFPPSNDGYGFCTGTSMAAPHIAGVYGVLRSINPLVSSVELTNRLKLRGTMDAYSAGSTPTAVAGEMMAGGYGWINTRLTPAFVLRNSVDRDRLYTAKPQVAVGAATGEFLAFPSCTIDWPIPSCLPPTSGEAALRPYFGVSASEANIVLGGTYSWPTVLQGLPTPRASFYVFTTKDSPYANVGLVPLRRLALASQCNWRSSAYATDLVGFEYFETSDFCPQSGVQSYKFDGIEGYVLESCPAVFGTCNTFADPTAPQPLYRRYSSVEQSYALILGSQLGNPVFSTYTTSVPGGIDVIGYVFPNIDSDGDTLIDGMERMLGFNPNMQDSDSDGVSDGMEYPMLTIP